MLKKLRNKFIWITMCIVTALLVMIFTLQYQMTVMNLDQRADGFLRALSNSAEKPSGIFEEQDVGLPYILIQVSPRGEILASGVTSYNLNDKEFVYDLIRQVFSYGDQWGELKDLNLRFYRNSSKTGECVAMVDVSSHSNTLENLFYTSLGIGLACLAGFFVISILLARWAMKPVEKAWQAQKQFVSDASHELKTPLTVIMSNAELLQEPLDEEERARYAQNVQVMATRMRGLTQGMLELARVDNGQVQKSFTTLDLSRLVSDAVLPFEPTFFERDMVLESQVTENISVTGNETYLRQVVEILLENALKYSEPGMVLVKLERYGRNQCVLSVANPGAPIPKEEYSQIFERFYREDKARTGTEGFGLGLAIAKSTVEEHKGKIWVQSNEYGNCFFVLLPLN